MGVAELDAIGTARALTPEESSALFRALCAESQRRARVPERIQRARKKLALLRVRRLRTERQIADYQARIARLEAELYPQAKIDQIEREITNV